MNAKEFILGYQTSNDDWLVKHEEVIVKLMEEYAKLKLEEHKVDEQESLRYEIDMAEHKSEDT